MSSQISLATPNGCAIKQMEDMSLGDGSNIDVIELHQQEPCGKAYNENVPDDARRVASDLSSKMLSSFKNEILSSNGPNTRESSSVSVDTFRVEPNENFGNEHHEEHNGAHCESTLDSACNQNIDANSPEKLDFQPVSELQELAGAFPSTFRNSLSSSDTAEDQSNLPATTTTARSLALRPSSPCTHGHDARINNAHMNPYPGRPEGGMGKTNSSSANSQSLKGEFHQHQEHSTILKPSLHPQSQFLLTISAPSPVPSQSGHFESSETGLPYQHQSSQIGEAPRESPKDACQLPECVMKRACAGAQLEHLLAQVKHEKTMSRACAWEEGAKAKAFNRYARDESKITAWENTMKAKAEARMRKAQENLDKQRAKHIEKMKNAVASAHCKAQEKRAAIEAHRAEDIVKAEEIASHIRVTGKMPRRCLCAPI